MTTEQIERIQAVVRQRVAVYCTAADEEHMLFDAMRWNRPLGGYDDPAYYWLSSEGVDDWDCAHDKPGVPNGYRVIDFSTLIAPHPLIIGLRAAAEAQGIDLEWLDVDVPFEYKNERFVVALDDGVPKVLWWNEKDRCSYYSVLTLMFAHPDQIHPIPKYSAETVEDAKAAMRLCGSQGVLISKSECGQPSVYDGHGFYHALAPNTFKDIQPGQCVPLADIVGG